MIKRPMLLVAVGVLALTGAVYGVYRHIQEQGGLKKFGFKWRRVTPASMTTVEKANAETAEVKPAEASA
jgi:hypothetical protein